ncbi:hypothetical protein [Bradyrhizobium sp. SZCCHNR1039]|uniref:hypothetical protein n=1 Tax=Bradyrhizobium sp. SZCCHNR1039 TaxID=3057350 RepID=UPI0029169A0B|nr:hypothetical protein [Bradyrhizobium sp. SZCCHNR1039]
MMDGISSQKNQQALGTTVHAVLVATIGRLESNPAQTRNFGGGRRALTQQLSVFFEVE